jgi:hypothetical protein
LTVVEFEGGVYRVLRVMVFGAGFFTALDLGFGVLGFEFWVSGV